MRCHYYKASPDLLEIGGTGFRDICGSLRCALWDASRVRVLRTMESLRRFCVPQLKVRELECCTQAATETPLRGNRRISREWTLRVIAGVAPWYSDIGERKPPNVKIL